MCIRDSYNGALIMEPSTQKKLYNNHFNKGQLAYLKELFTRFDVWPLAYSFSGDKEYVSWIEGKETDGVKRYLERRRGDARLHPIQRREELRDDDIFYFTCIGKKEDLDGLHELVEQSLDIRCIYEQEMYRTDYWCEIMPVGTSKGCLLYTSPEGEEQSRAGTRESETVLQPGFHCGQH